ncbi:hypothetical protein M378DRAFT_78708, partial [Amanita muscaria Koide BX008]
PLKGHTGKVTSVVFSPDGMRLASSSSDRTIYIWDAGTEELYQDWREHVVLDPHGWVLGPQGRLLVWIPEANRKCFLLPKVLVTIPKHAAELDLSSMAHGYFWEKCYDG